MGYAIRGLLPRADIDMGRHGFCIDLAPEWREMIGRAGKLDQQAVDNWIRREGRVWLDRSGFDRMFDPDNSGFGRDTKKPPGPNAYPSYSPHEIRVKWGEWGPEHISVPGNACGLDIERRSFNNLFGRGGVQLVPHNIDSLNQKFLLLIVFTEIAELVYLFGNEVKG